MGEKIHFTLRFIFLGEGKGGGGDRFIFAFSVIIISKSYVASLPLVYWFSRSPTHPFWLDGFYKSVISVGGRDIISLQSEPPQLQQMCTPHTSCYCVLNAYWFVWLPDLYQSIICFSIYHSAIASPIPFILPSFFNHLPPPFLSFLPWSNILQ